MWCAALLLAAGASPLAGQAAPKRFEVGVGIGVADTKQHAVAAVGTFSWKASGVLGGLALRAFVDSEVGMRDFKEGLHYDEATDRQYIIDDTGLRQNPRGDELWQGAGWDAHVALYGTVQLLPRIHPGIGYAYNGLDSDAGLSYLLYFYATQKTELGVEWLAFEGSRWRFRITFGFWRF